MRTLMQIEDVIKRKEDLIKILQEEILELSLKLTKEKSDGGQCAETVEN